MRRHELEFFRLEDRVLFEAAAVAEIVEAAEAAQDNPNANVSEGEKQAQEDREALKNAPPENPAQQAAQNPGEAQDDPADAGNVDAQIDQLINGDLPVTDAAPAANGDAVPGDDAGAMTDALLMPDADATLSTGKELVVINGTVPEREAILAELKPNQEVLILDDGSGLDQLNDYLDAHEGKYDAIHFVTHGREGLLSINGEHFDAEHVDASEWSAVGEHLTNDGDILLYGCDIAATAEGKLLVDRIAEASGADVAASDDATGVSGDWDLEYTVGDMETAAVSIDGYDHDLSPTTITVDTLFDDDDASTVSLRDAITQADTEGGEYWIEFSVSGTISLDRGVLNISNQSGTDFSLTIDGGGEITLDGDGQTQILNINTTGVITLKDIALTNGKATNGGGIYATGGGSLTLDGVTIANCTASDGGGIYATGNGSLTLQNSTISENTATSYSGGIYLTNGSSAIENSTISGNTAGAFGGGIYLTNGSSAIENSTIYENMATSYGGGIYSRNSSIKIVDSEITKNNSDTSGSSGGGIYAIGNGSLMLQNSTIAENTARYGGGIYSNGAQTTIQNSTIYGNTAVSYGGGIYLSNGSSTIQNSTIYGNTTWSGGGIYASNSSINIVNSTITGNVSSSSGGGLDVASSPSINIFNSIIYGNYTNAAADDISANEDAVTINIAYSLYGSTNITFNNSEGSQTLGADDLGDIFSSTTVRDGLTVAALTDNRYVALNNQGIAAYAGTLIAQTESGFIYRTGSRWVEIADSAWRDASGNPVDAPDTSEILASDQNGSSRMTAFNQLRVTDFAMGAAVPAVYLYVTSAGDTSVTYNGSGQGISAYTFSTASKTGVSDPAAILSGSSATEGDVGQYTVNVTGAAVNYEGKDVSYLHDFAFGSGKLYISAKTISVSGIVAEDKVYDGTTNATLNFDNVSFIGVCAGDSFSLSPGSGTFADKNAGIDKEVTITGLKLTGTDAGNYVLDTDTVTVRADITQRNIVLTSGSAWKYYDGTPLTDHTYTISGDGFVAGEGLETVFTAGSQTVPGSSANTIRSYTFTSDTNAGNYNITIQEGTLTVEVSPSAWTSLDPGPGALNWNETAVVPAVLGNALATGEIDAFPDGNLYTAGYSTLIAEREANRTFRSVFGNGELLFRNGAAPGWETLFASTLSRPGKTGFTLDFPIRDVGGSVVGNQGNVIFKESLGSGYELFPDSFSFTLKAERGPADFQFSPREVQLPERFFDASPQDDFAGLGEQLETTTKLRLFKSDLELLLDEMVGV